MMKRWIVNATERTVRPECVPDQNGCNCDVPQPGEFFWIGTYADAMSAGARRRLAEEALENGQYARALFTIVGDRIEPVSSNMHDVRSQTATFEASLLAAGYEVWREGAGLVVLGRLP